MINNAGKENVFFSGLSNIENQAKDTSGLNSDIANQDREDPVDPKTNIFTGLSSLRDGSAESIYPIKKGQNDPVEDTLTADGIQPPELVEVDTARDNTAFDPIIPPSHIKGQQVVEEFSDLSKSIPYKSSRELFDYIRGSKEGISFGDNGNVELSDKAEAMRQDALNRKTALLTPTQRSRNKKLFGTPQVRDGKVYVGRESDVLKNNLFNKSDDKWLTPDEIFSIKSSEDIPKNKKGEPITTMEEIARRQDRMVASDFLNRERLIDMVVTTDDIYNRAWDKLIETAEEQGVKSDLDKIFSYTEKINSGEAKRLGEVLTKDEIADFKDAARKILPTGIMPRIEELQAMASANSDLKKEFDDDDVRLAVAEKTSSSLQKSYDNKYKNAGIIGKGLMNFGEAFFGAIDRGFGFVSLAPELIDASFGDEGAEAALYARAGSQVPNVLETTKERRPVTEKVSVVTHNDKVYEVAYDTKGNVTGVYDEQGYATEIKEEEKEEFYKVAEDKYEESVPTRNLSALSSQVTSGIFDFGVTAALALGSGGALTKARGVASKLAKQEAKDLGASIVAEKAGEAVTLGAATMMQYMPTITLDAIREGNLTPREAVGYGAISAFASGAVSALIPTELVSKWASPLINRKLSKTLAQNDLKRALKGVTGREAKFAGAKDFAASWAGEIGEEIADEYGLQPLIRKAYNKYLDATFEDVEWEGFDDFLTITSLVTLLPSGVKGLSSAYDYKSNFYRQGLYASALDENQEKVSAIIDGFVDNKTVTKEEAESFKETLSEVRSDPAFQDLMKMDGSDNPDAKALVADLFYKTRLESFLTSSDDANVELDSEIKKVQGKIERSIKKLAKKNIKSFKKEDTNERGTEEGEVTESNEEGQTQESQEENNEGGEKGSTPTTEESSPEGSTPGGGDVSTEGEEVQGAVGKNDPEKEEAVKGATGRESVVGQVVDYNGFVGELVKKEGEGYKVVDLESGEEVLVESGESDRSNEEIGIKTIELDTDFENGGFTYNGKKYQYIAIDNSSDGEVVRAVREKDGKEVTIRNKQAVMSIVKDKIAWEIANSGKVVEEADVEAAADELSIKKIDDGRQIEPTDDKGEGQVATSTSEGVQLGRSSEDIGEDTERPNKIVRSKSRSKKDSPVFYSKLDGKWVKVDESGTPIENSRVVSSKKLIAELEEELSLQDNVAPGTIATAAEGGNKQGGTGDPSPSLETDKVERKDEDEKDSKKSSAVGEGIVGYRGKLYAKNDKGNWIQVDTEGVPLLNKNGEDILASEYAARGIEKRGEKKGKGSIPAKKKETSRSSETKSALEKLRDKMSDRKKGGVKGQRGTALGKLSLSEKKSLIDIRNRAARGTSVRTKRALTQLSKDLVGIEKLVVDSLKLFLPYFNKNNISLVFHRSYDSFANELEIVGQDPNIAFYNNGFYSKDGDLKSVHIYLGSDGLVETTGIHEALHPIVDEILKTPKLFNLLFAQLESSPVFKQLGIDDFMQRYSKENPGLQKEEGFVEFLASALYEDIKRDALKDRRKLVANQFKNFWDIVLDFISKNFNIPIRATIPNSANLGDFTASLSDVFLHNRYVDLNRSLYPNNKTGIDEHLLATVDEVKKAAQRKAAVKAQKSLNEPAKPPLDVSSGASSKRKTMSIGLTPYAADRIPKYRYLDDILNTPESTREEKQEVVSEIEKDLELRVNRILPKGSFKIKPFYGVWGETEISFELVVDLPIEDALFIGAKLGQEFDQDAVHVRQFDNIVDENTVFGVRNEDGSATVPYANIEFNKGLTNSEFYTILQEVGLAGGTLSTDGMAALVYNGETFEGDQKKEALESNKSFLESVKKLESYDSKGIQGTIGERGYTLLFEQRRGDGEYGRGEAGEVQGTYGWYTDKLYNQLSEEVKEQIESSKDRTKWARESLKRPVAKALEGIVKLNPRVKNESARDYKRLESIGNMFDRMVMADMSPRVVEAYSKLTDVLMLQYKDLPIKVYPFGKAVARTDARGAVLRNADGSAQVDFVPETSDVAYDGSGDMINDVDQNNQMVFYVTGGSTFGNNDVDYTGHPLLEQTGISTTRIPVLDEANNVVRDQNGEIEYYSMPMVYNDLLRVVHDYIAHAASGATFGARGEERAWAAHVSSIIADDRIANEDKIDVIRTLTTETRGQNTWVNFVNENNKEVNRLLEERRSLIEKGDPIDGINSRIAALGGIQFSDQKVGLLPTEVLIGGYPETAQNDKWIQENLTGDEHVSPANGSSVRGEGASVSFQLSDNQETYTEIQAKEEVRINENSSKFLLNENTSKTFLDKRRAMAKSAISKFRLQKAGTEQTPQEVVQSLVDKLSEGGLSKSINLMTQEELQKVLEDLGVDATLAKQVMGLNLISNRDLPRGQHTNIATLKKHKEYDSAKSGSAKSAYEVVGKVFKDDKITTLSRFPDAEIVAVRGIEKSGVNALPLAFAGKLAKTYGNIVNSTILLDNKPNHTGATLMARLLNPAVFAGEVVKGKQYYLVDDVTTSGGTITDLKNYIETKGGIVVGYELLAASRNGTDIRPTRREIQILEAKFGGKVFLDNFVTKYISDYGTRGLSKQQVRYLSEEFKDADSIRKRIFEEYDRQAMEGIDRTLPTRFQKELSEKGITPTVAGFVNQKTGDVYIDKNNPNIANTLIHEHGHLLLSHLEVNNPEMYEAATSLINGNKAEAQPYADYVKQTQHNLEEGSKEFNEEVLAQVIGDNGARLLESKKQNSIKQWLSDFWNFIKDSLGLSNFTADQVRGMTLKEFGEAASVSILRGDFTDKNGEVNFNRWKGNNRLVQGTEVQDVKTGEPIVVRGFHGTTNEFYEFDSSVKGNIEGHLGKINYFTTDFQDASVNYQADGADITGRIEREVERIEQEFEERPSELYQKPSHFKKYFNIDITQKEIDSVYGDERAVAELIASKKLLGGTEQVLDLYIKLNNPVVLGKGTTWFETLNVSEEDLDIAAEEIAEENDISIEEAKEDYYFDIQQRAIENTGYENLHIESLQEALRNNGYDSNLAIEILGDNFYESEIDLNAVEQRMRKVELLFKNEDGEIAGSQVIADFFKNLGFDGVILTDVSKRFPNMGLGSSTSHIHVFDEFNNQIKLADGSNVTFGETSDIRFQNQTEAQEYFTREADRLPLTLAVFQRPEFLKMQGKMVKPISVLNSLNQTGIKQIEKDLIKNIIEKNYQGQGKISYDELEATVRANIMPLERIFTSTDADDGMGNLGDGNYGNANTIILNSPIEHGVTGHFPGDFKASGRKNIKYVPKQLNDNVWVAVEEGYENQGANENNIYQFVGTAGAKEAVDAWIENYEIKGQGWVVYEQKDDLPPKRLKLFSTTQKAEEWIRDNKDEYEGDLEYERGFDEGINKGLFGHMRVWQDGQVFYVAELQSDYFQKNNARKNILDVKLSEEVYKKLNENRKKSNIKLFKELGYVLTEDIDQFIISYNDVVLKQITPSAYNVTIKAEDFFEDYLRGIPQIILNIDNLPKNFTFDRDTQRAGVNYVVYQLKGKNGEVLAEGRDRQETVDNYRKQESKKLLEATEKSDSLFNKERNKLIQKIEEEKYKKLSSQEKQLIASQKIWEQRMVREAIKEASLSGATSLRFPTPYTLSVIEGYIRGNESTETKPYQILEGDSNNLKEGDVINYLNKEYIIVESNENSIKIVEKVQDDVTQEIVDDIIVAKGSEQFIKGNKINDDKYIYRGFYLGEKGVLYVEKAKKPDDYETNEMYFEEGMFESQGLSRYSYFEKYRKNIEDVVGEMSDKEFLEFMEDAEIQQQEKVNLTVEDATKDFNGDFELPEYTPDIEEIVENVLDYTSSYKVVNNRVYSTESTETLKQPDKYTSQKSEGFDISTMLSREEQTVARKYEQIAQILKTERGDNFETVTDENGFDWYETKIEATETQNPVVAFQNQIEAEVNNSEGSESKTDVSDYSDVIDATSPATEESLVDREKVTYLYARENLSARDFSELATTQGSKNDIVVKMQAGESLQEALEKSKRSKAEAIVTQFAPEDIEKGRRVSLVEAIVAAINDGWIDGGYEGGKFVLDYSGIDNLLTIKQQEEDENIKRGRKATPMLDPYQQVALLQANLSLESEIEIEMLRFDRLSETDPDFEIKYAGELEVLSSKIDFKNEILDRLRESSANAGRGLAYIWLVDQRYSLYNAAEKVLGKDDPLLKDVKIAEQQLKEAREAKQDAYEIRRDSDVNAMVKAGLALDRSSKRMLKEGLNASSGVEVIVSELKKAILGPNIRFQSSTPASNSTSNFNPKRFTQLKLIRLLVDEIYRKDKSLKLDDYVFEINKLLGIGNGVNIDDVKDAIYLIDKRKLKGGKSTLQGQLNAIKKLEKDFAEVNKILFNIARSSDMDSKRALSAKLFQVLSDIKLAAGLSGLSGSNYKKSEKAIDEAIGISMGMSSSLLKSDGDLERMTEFIGESRRNLLEGVDGNKRLSNILDKIDRLDRGDLSILDETSSNTTSKTFSERAALELFKAKKSELAFKMGMASGNSLLKNPVFNNIIGRSLLKGAVTPEGDISLAKGIDSFINIFRDLMTMWDISGTGVQGVLYAASELGRFRLKKFVSYFAVAARSYVDKDFANSLYTNSILLSPSVGLYERMGIKFSPPDLPSTAQDFFQSSFLTHLLEEDFNFIFGSQLKGAVGSVADIMEKSQYAFFTAKNEAMRRLADDFIEYATSKGIDVNSENPDVNKMLRLRGAQINAMLGELDSTNKRRLKTLESVSNATNKVLFASKFYLSKFITIGNEAQSSAEGLYAIATSKKTPRAVAQKHAAKIFLTGNVGVQAAGIMVSALAYGIDEEENEWVPLWKLGNLFKHYMGADYGKSRIGSVAYDFRYARTEKDLIKNMFFRLLLKLGALDENDLSGNAYKFSNKRLDEIAVSYLKYKLNPSFSLGFSLVFGKDAINRVPSENSFYNSAVFLVQSSSPLSGQEILSNAKSASGILVDTKGTKVSVSSKSAALLNIPLAPLGLSGRSMDGKYNTNLVQNYLNFNSSSMGADVDGRNKYFNINSHTRINGLGLPSKIEKSQFYKNEFKEYVRLNFGEWLYDELKTGNKPNIETMERRAKEIRYQGLVYLQKEYDSVTEGRQKSEIGLAEIGFPSQHKLKSSVVFGDYRIESKMLNGFANDYFNRNYSPEVAKDALYKIKELKYDKTIKSGELGGEEETNKKIASIIRSERSTKIKEFAEKEGDFLAVLEVLGSSGEKEARSNFKALDKETKAMFVKKWNKVKKEKGDDMNENLIIFVEKRIL